MKASQLVKPHHDWSEFFGEYADDARVLSALARHWQYHEPAYERLRRRLSSGARILDVGCGVGASAFLLTASGYQCDGIDLEPTAVARATGIASMIRSSARFTVGSVMELPYPDNSYDATFSMGVLEHFDDKAFVRALSEQARVAPLVMTILPTRFTALCHEVIDERFFRRGQMRRLHEAAGLRVVDVVGYGSPSGSGRLLHRAVHYVLPTGVGLLLERRLGYSNQYATIAVCQR
jgi:SAM-dependent methyltransferase